nr:MAG TPA: hypothetical protein [Herelleviridae sp.]
MAHPGFTYYYRIVTCEKWLDLMPVNMKHAKSLQLWRTPRPGSGLTAACSPRLSG